MANYSIIYGSLGTAIATLVWLYLTAYAVLLGAELNGTLYRERMKNQIIERRIHQAASAEEPGQLGQPENFAPLDPMHQISRPEPAGTEPGGPIPEQTAPYTPTMAQEILVLDSPEMPHEASQH